MNDLDISIKAEKLFEKLGYVKYDNHPDDGQDNKWNWTTQDCRIIEYIQNKVIKGIEYNLYIRFHFNGKVVEIGANRKEAGVKEMPHIITPILNADEVNAIYYQCKEFGWNK